MTQACRLSSDELRGILFDWMNARRSEPPLAGAVGAWCELLSDARRFQEFGGDLIATLLRQRLATLAAWGCELERQACAATASTALSTWLTAAKSLSAEWPPASVEAWRRNLLNPSREGNRLVRGCVILTLADALAESRSPNTEKSGLIDLLRREQQSLPAWPLPPGTGRPWTDQGYYFGHRNAGAWKAVRAALDTLGAVVSELAHLQRLDRAREASTAPLARATRETIDAIGDLGKFTEQGRTGVPILVDAWQKKLSAYLELATRFRAELARRSPPHGVRLGERLDALNQTASELSAGLALASDCADEGGREAGAKLAPSSVRSTESAAPQTGPFAKLCAALDAAGDERAAQLARRIERWSQAAAQGAPGGEIERQLLTCLTYLDDLAAERRVPAWVEPARVELRAAVERRGAFIRLDAQLIGQKLVDVVKLAEGCGMLQTARPAPGHVARVVRPGYAFAIDGRIGEVLIRARVFIAEAEEERSPVVGDARLT